jgi:hypothetical protein
MTFIEIRDDVIKPKLIDILGKAMAESIYKNAGFATLGVRGEQETLQAFLEKTCSDPRFVGMWGTSQAEKQKREWLELLS